MCCPSTCVTLIGGSSWVWLVSCTWHSEGHYFPLGVLTPQLAKSLCYRHYHLFPLCLHSLNKYLLSTYYVWCTRLSNENTKESMVDIDLVLTYRHQVCVCAPWVKVGYFFSLSFFFASLLPFFFLSFQILSDNFYFLKIFLGIYFRSSSYFVKESWL